MEEIRVPVEFVSDDLTNSSFRVTDNLIKVFSSLTMKEAKKLHRSLGKYLMIHGEEESASTARLNQPELVDLGLPSGTLWMTHNVGATKPEEAGKYFAWGDTEGFYENEIPSGSFTSLWYTNRKGHELTGDIVPGGEYDAVTAAYGAGFQMPTFEDFKELLVWTQQSVETINGIKGTKFTNKTDSTKFIFIPFAGYDGNGEVYSVGHYSCVWSSIVSTDDTSDAWFLTCYSNGSRSVSSVNRYYGQTVRGVLKKNSSLI